MDIKTADATSLLALDERVDGTMVYALRGQKVLLALPSFAASGYVWSFTSLGGLDMPAVGTFEPAPGVIGEHPLAAVFVWKTSLQKPGTHILKMELRRPWEKEPLRSFCVTLAIN